MVKPTPTRTLNPLPFNDLDPSRFEDLVRQLAYDFRPWRRLEATGRAGSDDGFDARGYEIIGLDVPSELDDAGDAEDAQVGMEPDRLWLIQCKRERAIGPSKLTGYLDEIALSGQEPLYGLIFAAPCTFSKRARDDLTAWCRDHKVLEWHVWGRSEIEDMLLQPRFDHLLFAYFGISLTVRNRNQTTELRRQLALKRRIRRVMEKSGYCLALIRDIDDRQFPEVYRNEGTRPRYVVRAIKAITPYGLAVDVSMREAWLSEDESAWDAALGSRGNGHIDEWNEPTDSEAELTQQAREAWHQLTESEKAWLHVEGIIAWENILFLDDVGDSAFEGTHLYVRGWDSGYQHGRVYIEAIGVPGRRKDGISPDTPGRLEKFPEATRAAPKKWGY